jgi:aryl-alcohol dehydrogenase-like predicted oxidoreductase
MKYRRLGTSDLRVSEISLGTYYVGVEEKNAQACIKRALDCGINFFDTANAYGRGASETLLGKILADRPRQSYLLATKVYFPVEGADGGLSKVQILRQIEASLKRLRTDHVDLYQCHRHDDDTPIHETMEALTEAVKSGKARYIGFSEWTPQQIANALAVPGAQAFVSSQPQYSLLRREAESDLFAYCEAQGISQIVWSPLGQGVLTGKYLPDAPIPEDSRANSVRGGMADIMQPWLRPQVLRAAQRLKSLAEEAGCTLPQLALAWVLRDPRVTSAIIGASRPEQVAENVVATELRLDDAIFKQAEDIVSALTAD